MEDPFIREHIEELLRNIRTQVLIKLIRPYTRVRITFIAQVIPILNWFIYTCILLYYMYIHFCVKYTVSKQYIVCSMSIYLYRQVL